MALNQVKLGHILNSVSIATLRIYMRDVRDNWQQDIPYPFGVNNGVITPIMGFSSPTLSDSCTANFLIFSTRNVQC